MSSITFTDVSGGVVIPSGLVGVSGLWVPSLGMLSMSSSLSALTVSSCVFHCQHVMVHGLDGVHLNVSALQVFQALLGLEHGRGPHICRLQVSSCIAIGSPSFLGVHPLMLLAIVLVSGSWLLSCLSICSSSLGVFAGSLGFFSDGGRVLDVLGFTGAPSDAWEQRFGAGSPPCRALGVWVLHPRLREHPSLPSVAGAPVAPGGQFAGRGRPSTWQWQVLPCLGPARGGARSLGASA